MNYSFASISADHLGYNITIFDVADDKLVRVLSSENSPQLNYQNIIDATPKNIEMATVNGVAELRARIARTRHIKVLKPTTVKPGVSLGCMADKLNSGQLAVASQYQREILSSLRSSTPDEIPHNIRSLINICDTWGIWVNFDMYRYRNTVTSWG
jgi:hypothetical protein